MPNFDKKEQDLKTDLDKWFYLLKNLSKLKQIPKFLDKRVFQKIFKIAEMSKMTKEEHELYYSDVKAKSDWNAGIRFAEKKAAEKAAAIATANATLIATEKIAKSLKKKGMSFNDIAEVTELRVEDIELL